MEVSPLNHKTHNHARSNSLPSKPHPVILQCNEHLARLGGASDATSSSSLLSHKLSALQDLHNTVEKLIQLPQTQEALVQEHQEQWVDELLDGSLKLLDTCTATKDALLHTKECTRELQSIIRRRRGEEVELTLEVKKFLSSRKVVRKAIFKALENLKGHANNCNLFITNKDYQTVASVNLLKEVEVITLSIFESLLNFICGSTQSKRSTWSLVSKLMHSKRVSYSLGVDENEFAKVDAALQFFALNMASKSNDIDDLRNKLARLGSCIQDLEEGLESLFRRLIKIRVSLLNILNH
ncbi:uncharacterized protein LOC133297301 [Gastrolobium bilobum]|uniref:uncharacterized protein LOC133297301 n=1 Tax=Gastrolobium bilobum TaxID=150636 RepID=UPI002AB1316E|nr:uncharacterized protein LOC133297301 [Gastrolobium bilobum]